MRLINLATIANDLQQYDEMRASFVAAGFTEDVCRYTLFDNTSGNLHEPYSTINMVMADATEPYLIFCHQDILCDQGHDYKYLLRVIAELEKKDPKWAVAGNAGFSSWFKRSVCITDPGNGEMHQGNLPLRVISLDENFLILKTSTPVRCSHELKGFHLYATDFCLSAHIKHYRAYVVNFHVRHLSRGNANSKAFNDSRDIFLRRWRRDFTFACVITPSTKILISRYVRLEHTEGLLVCQHYLHQRFKSFFRSLKRLSKR